MSRGPFDDLDFEGFRRAATRENLSEYAKIGFPDSYRAGREAAILADIESKLTNLGRAAQTVLDIGPGCSPLPRLLAETARARGHRLFLADSAEMLAQLPDEAFVEKLPGRFPQDHRAFLLAQVERFDVVLVYSVLHYVFVEASLHDFLDAAVALLAHGGQLLVGDIPNVSMRRRFFSTPAGVAFHQQFTGTQEPPPADPTFAVGKIDDGVLLGLVARYRAAGCHAFLLPQAPALPMWNRREDLLIVRP